ncbi:TadE/TadG family type IV pilus assembly protein [Jiangella sp. DSM 45060]|uniref:TadE/TadG family type IV pilus assembly protein n=1 Tax=Jiangella sp. DSM 45060 TaxID=1798224 RepID=UPI00087D7A5C|nr:TadE/TadG family type IV pilus assembly protein [Jiangella sp. DSM 45060]SDT70344.1 Flp pilus assembly protein TadG [Jiangella sp. DSM 45060]
MIPPSHGAHRRPGPGPGRSPAGQPGRRPPHWPRRSRAGRPNDRAPRWPRLSQAGRPDRGSATLELAILAPGLLLLIALIALAGRYAIADGVVDQAAAEAARAASLQRTTSAGLDAATEVARAALADQGLTCLHTEIDVDVAGLRAPPGRRGRVTVTVRCPLRVADLPLHVPAITLTATAVSPVDTYRER